MYHLLITANKNAWDGPSYEYPRERVGEASTFKVENKIAKLTASVIEELKSYPALFAYEGRVRPWRVGYIRSIKAVASRIKIKHEFDEGIQEIPFGSIEPLLTTLHIERDEIHRTHWAVKDKDLFDILETAGLVGGIVRPSAGRIEDMRFKVALSFPGELRGYVIDVVKGPVSRAGLSDCRTDTIVRPDHFTGEAKNSVTDEDYSPHRPSYGQSPPRYFITRTYCSCAAEIAQCAPMMI